MRALLLGSQPGCDLGYTYVSQPPYEAVVLGSVTLGQLLRLDCDPVPEALAAGKPVVLYTPGLPSAGSCRALGASLAARQRELKSWGVVFTDGGQKRLVTAEMARVMKAQGRVPGPGAVLTPLAKEILEEML